MTKMKKLTLSVFCLFTMLFLFSCDTNQKLAQDSAAKAIRQFISSDASRFKVEQISSIEPVSQFTEAEASSIVRFNYHDNFANGNLVLKFKFQKNMDKKWILMSLEPVEGVGTQGVGDWVRKNQNINIVAQ